MSIFENIVIRAPRHRTAVYYNGSIDYAHGFGWAELEDDGTWSVKPMTSSPKPCTEVHRVRTKSLRPLLIVESWASRCSMCPPGNTDGRHDDDACDTHGAWAGVASPYGDRFWPGETRYWGLPALSNPVAV